MMSDQELKTPVEIIDFKPKYAKAFRDINYAWLEKYFSVEVYDRIVLEDPQNQIIAHGGHILLARVGGEIVGVCALLKQTESKYELAKMGVREKFRGRGLGRLLAEAAITKARELGATTLVLATSRSLITANHLYHRLGFIEVDRSEIGPLPYKRESIVMALELSAAKRMQAFCFPGR